jgi:hypothetical protein
VSKRGRVRKPQAPSPSDDRWITQGRVEKRAGRSPGHSGLEVGCGPGVLDNSKKQTKKTRVPPREAVQKAAFRKGNVAQRQG